VLSDDDKLPEMHVASMHQQFTAMRRCSGVDAGANRPGGDGRVWKAFVRREGVAPFAEPEHLRASFSDFVHPAMGARPNSHKNATGAIRKEWRLWRNWLPGNDLLRPVVARSH